VKLEGSTKTITEIVTDILIETPSPPRRFLGELFMVSYDSPLEIMKPIPSVLLGNTRMPTVPDVVQQKALPQHLVVAQPL
jgi:hypothetical protein